MGNLTATDLLNSVVYLLTEAYAGPPDPSSTWFIDNEPDSGILGIVTNVSAAEASTSVDGSGESGTTIAANVEHLRWSLSMMNAAIRGQTFEGKWEESWRLLKVDDASWDVLRNELRAEFETLRQGLQAQIDLPGEYLTGTLALLPHAAYHLGTIRQMIERVRA
jgi:hypothetical protein